MKTLKADVYLSEIEMLLLEECLDKIDGNGRGGTLFLSLNVLLKFDKKFDTHQILE